MVGGPTHSPGRNSAEQVGELIADEYALLYETSRERMSAAARLRAEAAALRDAGADAPDWATIGGLLHQSYRELKAALATANAQRRAPERDWVHAVHGAR
jgi:hypothetical protein